MAEKTTDILTLASEVLDIEARAVDSLRGRLDEVAARATHCRALIGGDGVVIHLHQNI